MRQKFGRIFGAKIDRAAGQLLARLDLPSRDNESVSFPQMRTKSVCLLLFLCTSRLLIANSLGNNTTSPARTAVTSHIPRESVASKVIASIGYSKRLHILEIEFVNGAVYRYLEVAPSVYRDLMTADSKARYYDTNIKGNYPSVRVRPRVKQESD
jgi:hypothetical protein